MNNRLAAAIYTLRTAEISVRHCDVMIRNCPWWKPRLWDKYVEASFAGAYQTQRVDSLLAAFDRMVHGK